jgi:hypothetical protein
MNVNKVCRIFTISFVFTVVFCGNFLKFYAILHFSIMTKSKFVSTLKKTSPSRRPKLFFPKRVRYVMINVAQYVK